MLWKIETAQSGPKAILIKLKYQNQNYHGMKAYNLENPRLSTKNLLRKSTSKGEHCVERFTKQFSTTLFKVHIF